jgi:hypothetical protein
MNLDRPTEPDNYQQAWRAQSSHTRVTVDADSLLNVVQRNQRDFGATILRRDIIEVGVGLLLLPYWIYQGLTSSLPWTWWLGVPAIIWVVGFFLIDRMRHPQTPSDPGEPLLTCVKNSLDQVEHQIWLLRNIFWWYLLPFTVAIVAFFAQVTWSAWAPTDSWLETLAQAAVHSFVYVVLFATYGFVYWLNQRAVRTQLEPRRHELLKLHASLNDETTNELSGEYPILMSRETCKFSHRRLAVAALLFVVFLAIGIGGIFLGYSLDESYPEKSPFAAVRWQQSQPEVKVDDEWFKLVSVDGFLGSDIVAFSKRTYGDLWQKRFEEDLVELLTRMGHPPQDTVTLVVQSLTTSETRTLENVPMTRANRRAIRDAAQARERGEKQ